MRAPAPKTKLTFGSTDQDSDARLRELLLYIVEKCGHDARFGAIKLNKVLFWSDFYSFAATGSAITGVQYMRQDRGPVPKRLVPVREQLVASGDLDVSRLPLFNGSFQTRFFAKRRADVSMFSAEQLDLVNEIIEYLRDGTAREVSDETHGRTWKILANGELFPYEAVFVSDREPVEQDIQMIRDLGATRNWRSRIAERRGSVVEPTS